MHTHPLSLSLSTSASLTDTHPYIHTHKHTSPHTRTHTHNEKKCDFSFLKMSDFVQKVFVSFPSWCFCRSWISICIKKKFRLKLKWNPRKTFNPRFSAAAAKNFTVVLFSRYAWHTRDVVLTLLPKTIKTFWDPDLEFSTNWEDI